MTAKFQNKYRIEPNRWQNWDYSAPGYYFITICTHEREAIFGKIVNGEMILSEYGEIVKTEFVKMAQYNQRATIDEWVIMPNHVHCIIALGDYVEKIHEFSHSDVAIEEIHEFSYPDESYNSGDTTEKIHEFSLRDTDTKQYRRLRRKMLIPILLGKFQMQTSKQINILRNSAGQKTWQPNYHDHVIRDDAEYNRIQQYIINNPSKWGDDTFNDDEK